MSFEQIVTKNIDCDTINGAPIPASGVSSKGGFNFINVADGNGGWIGTASSMTNAGLFTSASGIILPINEYGPIFGVQSALRTFLSNGNVASCNILDGSTLAVIGTATYTAQVLGRVLSIMFHPITPVVVGASTSIIIDTGFNTFLMPILGSSVSQLINVNKNGSPLLNMQVTAIAASGRLVINAQTPSPLSGNIDYKPFTMSWFVSEIN